MITVVGDKVKSHLAALQQTAGKAAKVVSHNKLHFSVCNVQGVWSGGKLASLAEDIKWILQQPLPSSINDESLCDQDVFFNTNNNRRQGMLHSCVSDLLFASLQLTFCL